MAESIGAGLERFSGVGPGFDLLRVVLASGVVVWHCFPLTTGDARLVDATPLWFLVNVFVPMFFVVSGFLVTGSAHRVALGPYLLNRVARIVPALLCVVALSALVIGPLVTTRPPGAYLADPLVARYFGNVVGLVAYALPGVFEGLPTPSVVNGSLWTVRFEYACYIGLGGLVLLGLARRWWPYALAYLLLMLVAAWLAVACAAGAEAGATLPIGEGILPQAMKVLPYFLLGSLLYVLRDRVPFDGRLALLSAAAIPLVGLFGEAAWLKLPLFWLALAPVLAYLTVWLGLARLPKLEILGGGDFSYGIYLYHFPILQLLVPWTGVRDWWLLALMAALPVLLVAAASWHLVEKPALVLRKRFSLAGRRAAA